jgi:hypothetical protein
MQRLAGGLDEPSLDARPAIDAPASVTDAPARIDDVAVMAAEAPAQARCYDDDADRDDARATLSAADNVRKSERPRVRSTLRRMTRRATRGLRHRHVAVVRLRALIDRVIVLLSSYR